MRNFLRAGLVAGASLALTAGSAAVASAYPIHPHGKRVEVTVAGGCPASVAGDVTVANPGNGSAHLLVRRDPTKGLICSYDTDGSHLISGRAIGAGGAQRLARMTDRLNLAKPRGIYACPDDAGLVTVIAFAYSGGGHDALWYVPTGCATVDNGRIAAGQAGHPSFAKWSGYEAKLAK